MPDRGGSAPSVARKSAAGGAADAWFYVSSVRESSGVTPTRSAFATEVLFLELPEVLPSVDKNPVSGALEAWGLHWYLKKAESAEEAGGTWVARAHCPSKISRSGREKRQVRPRSPAEKPTLHTQVAFPKGHCDG
ncbi:hypothetical protein NDU88_006976 [Pleurodeles waltl]|uniref:Uncharacterized protein n=1 Tax=Pleurodeles waltl TaxID=8319 RepID=A0AAV7MIU4_PLEWA|nr:hypothetical protein NDU88_006976 [Pleurodeles waltl]